MFIYLAGSRVEGGEREIGEDRRGERVNTRWILKKGSKVQKFFFPRKDGTSSMLVKKNNSEILYFKNSYFITNGESKKCIQTLI